jgi:quinohemoprotein amine dehydrogenase
MFGEGSAILYTGFEWRATVNVGETTFNQTFALTSDGQALQGRMYQKDQVLVGARVKAIKQNERVALLSVYPRSLPIGETTRLTVSGFGLGLAEITIADANVEVIDAQDSSRVIVDVTPIDGASVGYRSVSLAGEEQTQAIAFYESVDELAVEPSYGIARIGGNGGGTPKVETVFRARGKSWGADQQPGTSDDLDLGYIDAVTWRTVPRDEGAEQDNDVAFAGNMDPITGRYVPAAAGPNPQRARSTNNAGNLNVVARYEAGEDVVEGTGRLLVTVQRWVNPPMN